jgi:hypothetical protein
MPITIGAGVIGLGTGLYQTISGAQQQKRGQRAFEEAMASRPQYEINDQVKQQLAEAQSRYNAKNPAIAMAYQQAQQGMAGQMANAQRNASSGAQALAAGASAQAQLQSLTPQLAAQQTAYQQQQQANLNQARGLMTEEQRAKFSDLLATNQARQNFGLGLAQAGSAMKSQGIGALIQGGLGLAAAGLSGQFGGTKTLPEGTEMTSIPSIGSNTNITPSMPTTMYKSGMPNVPTSSLTYNGLPVQASMQQIKTPSLPVGLAGAQQAPPVSFMNRQNIPAVNPVQPSGFSTQGPTPPNRFYKAFGAYTSGFPNTIGNENAFTTPIYSSF